MYLCGYIPSFNTMVKYKLTKADNALVFQVIEESADVKAFLNGNIFLSKSGLKIASSKYPEFKHSKNVLFLRGSDSSADSKLDATRFVGRMQRDNAYDMVVSAIQELVDAVKGFSKAYPVSGYFPNQWARPTRTRVKNSLGNAKVIIVA